MIKNKLKYLYLYRDHGNIINNSILIHIYYFINNILLEAMEWVLLFDKHEYLETYDKRYKFLTLVDQISFLWHKVCCDTVYPTPSRFDGEVKLTKYFMKAIDVCFHIKHLFTKSNVLVRLRNHNR